MGRRKGWNEEGMGQRKGWEGGRDGEEKGTGRRKGWGGGSNGEVEAMGEGSDDGRRKGWGGRNREETPRRETSRRVDGIWENVMAGRRDRDDGKTGFACCRVDPWGPR